MSGSDPLGPTDLSAGTKRSKPPWEVDYEKIPVGVGRYDASLFTNPSLLVRAPSATAVPTGKSASAAADAAWNRVSGAPMPNVGSVRAPGCSIPLATPSNAKLLADLGVPLSLSLEHGLIVTVAELEKFIDDYIAHTRTRPELRSLYEDALSAGPAIFAKRLDVEAAEQERAGEATRMHDRVAPMQVRPPIPIQHRAAVGEVAIPIAKAVDEVAKLAPIAGEFLMAAEAITGKTLGGLGYPIDRSERVVSAALLLAPFAAAALASGVRGAARLVRMARATGKTTEETRRLLVAVQAIKSNEVALREGIAAKRAGRALTPAQAEAFRVTDGALARVRGAAAQSIFDPRSRAGLPVRSFALNPNHAVRSLDEATAIAGRRGVALPSWLKIKVDPTVRESQNLAEYTLVKEAESTAMLSWEELAPDGTVSVKIHPSVLASDEKIVGVLQHEAWELTQLRARVESKGRMAADDIQKLIHPDSATNLHAQAWDVADLRVLIMREHEPVKRAVLERRLQTLMDRYQKGNVR